MASVRSLGLYEPSALDYLIAESILPQDPPPSLYKWQTCVVYDEESQQGIEEELVTTEKCVVWSRNGAVQRVYNLDAEGEAIIQAFTTQFVVSNTEIKRNESQDRGSVDALGKTRACSRTSQGKSLNRGLVVVLRSQAHIFLLSGDSHIIPLSFEVQTAFPTPFGFILQRKISQSLAGNRPAPYEAPGSCDSVAASLLARQRGSTTRPSLILPESQWRHNARSSQPVPRTFYLNEILTDLGLVVSIASKSKNHPLRGDALAEPLSLSEKIVYISAHDELKFRAGSPRLPLVLAVSIDSLANTMTFWQVLDRLHSNNNSPVRKKRANPSGHVTRRKSSNVYGRETGTATPVNRPGGQVRESFGGLAHSYAENIYQETNEQKTNQVEDLADQLGAEFGTVGVQTRSARRVSSMLARSDLAMGHDRNTFTDYATGQPSRKSMNRSIHRGESIGSFNDRQSFGPRRRSSFPGPVSVTSNGTSFLDVSSYGLMEGLEADSGIDGIEFDDMMEELPREVHFEKIQCLPYNSIDTEASMSENQVKVFALCCPDQTTSDDAANATISLCVMNGQSQDLTIITFSLRESHDASGDGKLAHGRSPAQTRIKAIDVRRGSNVIDACKVSDGSITRALTLTRTRDGRATLHLEAPWSSPLRLELPSQYLINDPLGVSPLSSPHRRHSVGLNRRVPNTNGSIAGVRGIGTNGHFAIKDQEGKLHRLQVQLVPHDGQVRNILAVCNFVVPGTNNDGLLLCWWEVVGWLKGQDYKDANLEWLAVVVVLFALLVPFVDDKTSSSALSQRRKKSGLLRSSSGTGADQTSWIAMLDFEGTGTSSTWRDWGGWKWMREMAIVGQPQLQSPPSPSRSRKTAGAVDFDVQSQDTLIVRCAALAREFLQTPAGEAAIGPEGYFPSAMNKSHQLRQDAASAVLIGLHLAREEAKLNTLAGAGLEANKYDLAPVLAQIGHWLGWEAWTWTDGTYYNSEIGDIEHWLFEHSVVNGLKIRAQPFKPPSVFAYIERCIREPKPPSFPTMLDIVGGHFSKSNPMWPAVVRLTPRTAALLAFLTELDHDTSGTDVLQARLSCGLDESILSSLPDGIAAVFHNAITSERSNRSGSAEQRLLRLLDRDDMESFTRGKEGPSISRPAQFPNHGAIRDHHTIGAIAFETDTLHTFDASTEADRQAITRLIFHHDRRFQEASKLVNQTRPPTVECNPEPGWSEAELLDAQKELVQYVTRRTLSVAAGRGMMHFDARVPLLTERVPIPAFSLQCIMKSRLGQGPEGSQQGMTFSADKAAFTEDKVCWAFFHNGASAGLMISKNAKGIDTSWILYNKPAELTNRHAGFLMALGLNGHLKSLAKWVAFKYLTPKHTMTSIGLLLGLSASYLGTMDTLITRLLSVHVTRLLPVGAAELNLSGLVQTAGIVGMGLVYFVSGHRRMSEVCLSEIENCEIEEHGGTIPAGGEETVLRDEGYRLAAGFSLGLINLGQGRRLDGLRDMNVLERLLSVAVGTKNVDFVNVLDRATAGAVIAVGFIWLKSNDEAIARKIDIPDTIHQFDYVRPDIFLLRTLARHLILWNKIEASLDFVEASLPRHYRSRATLTTTKWLSSDDMPFFNILAGICFAIGLRFAGSFDFHVRDLLVAYLDQLMRLVRLPALNYDAKLTRNSVRNCQDVVALALAAVMAGSGDLVVLRRLRALHGRTDSETPYGSHLAGHMAIGALFLGGGTCTFGTTDLAVATLVMSFWPVFPTSVLDNRSHLQALRHTWVLAVEHRCVTAREVGSGRAISVPMTVQMKNGEKREIQAPCLLPETDQMKSIEVNTGDYWDVSLDLASEHAKSNVNKNPSLWLRRRAAYHKPAGEVFMTELQALDEVSEIPSTSNTSSSAAWRAGQQGKSPFEWLFGLDALHDLDQAERALILPPYIDVGGTGHGLSHGSVVDTRLELEKGILEEHLGNSGMSKDQLWQLRLLFAWVDRWDEREERKRTDDDIRKGEGTWLRREVIDRLRYRVWKMAGGAPAEEQT